MDCFGNGLVDFLSNRLNSIHIDSAKAKEMALFMFFLPWMEFLSRRKCRSPRAVCWINWISVSYLTHLFVVKPRNYLLKILCKHNFSLHYKINHVFRNLHQWNYCYHLWSSQSHVLPPISVNESIGDAPISGSIRALMYQLSQVLNCLAQQGNAKWSRANNLH